MWGLTGEVGCSCPAAVLQLGQIGILIIRFLRQVKLTSGTLNFIYRYRRYALHDQDRGGALALELARARYCAPPPEAKGMITFRIRIAAAVRL